MAGGRPKRTSEQDKAIITALRLEMRLPDATGRRPTQEQAIQQLIRKGTVGSKSRAMRALAAHRDSGESNYTLEEYDRYFRGLLAGMEKNRQGLQDILWDFEAAPVDGLDPVLLAKVRRTVGLKSF